MERYTSIERLATYLDTEWSQELFDASEQGCNHPSRPLDPRLWVSQDFYQRVARLAKQFVSTTTPLRYADIGAATGRMMFEWCCSFSNIKELVWVEPSLLFGAWALMLLQNPDAIEQIPVVTDLEQIEYRTFSEQAKRKFPTRDTKGLQEKLQFCNVAVEELDYPKEYFDAITCLNLVDRHAEPLELVRLLWHLLKPEGVLILASPLDWRESYTGKTKWVTSLEALLPSVEWNIVERCDAYYDIRHFLFLN